MCASILADALARLPDVVKLEISVLPFGIPASPAPMTTVAIFSCPFERHKRVEGFADGMVCAARQVFEEEAKSVRPVRIQVAGYVFSTWVDPVRGKRIELLLQIPHQFAFFVVIVILFDNGCSAVHAEALAIVAPSFGATLKLKFLERICTIGLGQHGKWQDCSDNTVDRPHLMENGLAKAFTP